MYVNTGRHNLQFWKRSTSDARNKNVWHVLCKIIVNELPVFPGGISWCGHFNLIFIRLFKSLFCPIEMTKNTKIHNRQSIVIHKGELCTVVEFKEPLTMLYYKDKYWHFGFLLSLPLWRRIVLRVSKTILICSIILPFDIKLYQALIKN